MVGLLPRGRLALTLHRIARVARENESLGERLRLG
jgi:hypothetical protein